MREVRGGFWCQNRRRDNLSRCGQHDFGVVWEVDLVSRVSTLLSTILREWSYLETAVCKGPDANISDSLIESHKVLLVRAVITGVF